MIPSAEPQSERGEAYEVVAFDLRRPGLLKRLISQGAAWRGRAHIELLDPHHAVLVVRAGGAPSERGGPREAKGPAPVGVLALRRARWQAHQSPVLVGDRPARPLRRPRDVGHAQRGPRSRPQGRLRRRGFRLHCRRPLLWRGLDGCVDPETGEVASWAAEVLDELDSYTEFSPSGRGLHVLARAELPPGGRRKGRVEMYDRGRFFTVTGRHLPGTPRGIEERTGAASDTAGGS